MKRFQIHVTKQFRAEIIVEAESEQLARGYVLSLTNEQLNWTSDAPTKLEHVDEIDGEPEK